MTGGVAMNQKPANGSIEHNEKKDFCEKRGCGKTLTDGCISGCASCCFFYILLLISFVLGVVGLLILLGWVFGNMFTAAMPS